MQRARNGRGRQRQHVELRAQLLESLLLHDAESVLFVDHQQAETLEAHIALEQPMCADDDVDVACLQTFDRARLCLVVDEARQHLDHDREVLQPLAEHMEVLLGEHRCRGQHRNLLAAHRGFERRAQRELGLAETDVTAQQPVHRPVGLHVCLDLAQRRDLVRRLLIWKR